MKRLIITAVAAILGIAAMSAQKFALVDMEYILRNVPAYEMANEQLNQISQRWQKEVTELQKEAETMYKNYQNEKMFLTEDQKKKREEEIVAKEKEVSETRAKYFSPEGELYKKRQSLMKTSTTPSRPWPRRRATRRSSTAPRARASYSPRRAST